MTLWSTPDGRVAAAVGLACWAQLGLAPPLAHRADPLAVVSAAAALALLAAGVFDLPRRPALALPLATAGLFAALGLEALVLARHPVARFDLGTRVGGAVTAAAYVALAARARSLAAPRLSGVVTEVPGEAPPGPRLRAPALAALGAVVAFCAVAAPAWIAASAAAEGATRGVERILRGRHALTAGGGLCLAAVISLVAGSSLLRADAPRQRRFTRALTYGVWAGVAWSMRAWLERAR